MQDFTTFTDVDTPGRLTQITARSTFMGLRGSDADVYLWKAIVGALPANFTQEFEFYIDAADPTGGDRSVALVSYVQDLDDWEANRAGNKNQFSVMVDNVAAGPAPRVAIVETNGGTVYTSAATYSPAMDTLFYCSLIKVGTLVTLYIYSDAGRTTLVATLTLTLQATWAIGYVMAPQSNGSGDTDEISGYIQDMDDPESSEDLSAEFESGQNSEDLPAEFFAKQGSEDLPGEFMARRDAYIELPGEFEARRDAYVELPCEFIARHDGDEELLGYFEGQDTENLPAEFESGQGSVDLPAEFIARHEGYAFNELDAQFIARHDGYAELLGEFTPRRDAYAELPGEFIPRRDAYAELPGELIIRHADSEDLPAHFRAEKSFISKGLNVSVYQDLSIIA